MSIKGLVMHGLGHGIIHALGQSTLSADIRARARISSPLLDAAIGVSRDCVVAHVKQRALRRLVTLSRADDPMDKRALDLSTRMASLIVCI